MNAIALCFFCGTGHADHGLDHRLLGPRPCCPECDPATAAQRGRNTLERMTGAIVAWAQVGLVDLGDARHVDLRLHEDGFNDDEIALFQERAVEAARRQLQRTAARFHPFAHAAEAIAFLMLVSAWIVGFCLLNPPENHRHVQLQVARR